jgi:putative ABC transport system permease protein
VPAAAGESADGHREDAAAMMLVHDIRFAVRTLRRSPGYTLAALLTLMLGVGANAAVFSVVYGVVLAPLPYAEPDRLVSVWEENWAGRPMDAAWRNFEDWREQARGFASLVAYTPGREATVLVDGSPVRAGVASVSRGFLGTLGVAPRLGRGFLDEDHAPGAPPVAVVSDAFWRTHLGGTADPTSRRLDVAGMDAQVVGVMPPGFDHPAGTAIWMPLELVAQSASRTSHNYAVLGRLRPGIAIAAAKAELDAITDGFAAEVPGVTAPDGYGDFFPRSARVLPLDRALIGDAARPLWILLGASVLVLLVACVNLASATLARGTARDREYAVRRSLGAARGTVLRQLFTESAVLALAGGALAVLLAAAVVRALPTLAPAGIPRIAEVSLDVRVVAVAFGVSLLTAVLFGLLPALRVTEGAYAGVLRGGARAGHDRGRHRVWKVLVAIEVGMALVLLVGSGLLIRSFAHVLRTDPGYRTGGVLTATVSPPPSRYATPGDRGRYYAELLRELQATPGVARAGLVSTPPLASVANGRVDVRGGPAPGATGDFQLVGGDFFQVLGIALEAGRLFDERDRDGAPPVVIVNRAFAELAWPGDDPIGRQMTSGGMENLPEPVWATVVGVVGDVRQRDLTRPAQPTYYFPLAQRPFRSWSMTAVVEPAAGPPAALAPGVREAARRVDPQVPVAIATIETRVADALTPRRFTMLVLAVFSAIALALACVGIAGVVAYAVARRTREIGIRIALGADAQAVRRLLQLDTLRPALFGAAAGLLAALGLTRLLQSLLYETQPLDPLTFAAVAAVLGGAAWVASYVPARRGTRVSPMETMRAE